MSRIVILNWRDPWHPEHGGSEKYVQQVAERLAAQGHELGHQVTVFTAAYPGRPNGETHQGVGYVRRGGHLSVYLWAALFLALGRFGPLGRGHRIDAVLEVHNGMPFLARLFTRARVVVLVHHVHREQWPVVGPVLAKVGWFLESKVAVWVNLGNRYIAVSEVTRAELVGLGVRSSDVTVAYNGLPELPAYTPATKTAYPSIAVLSRLVPHKQVEHALRAAAALRADFPGLRMRIMGAGWWHDELTELCGQLGLDGSVEFLGFVDDRVKLEVLSSSWIHLLPSIKEGWGLSIVEAGFVGVPSVAYRTAGGVQESILDGVTGLLAADENDLIECTRRLLEDASLRHELGLKAEHRSTQFTWDNTTKAIADALTG